MYEPSSIWSLICCRQNTRVFNNAFGGCFVCVCGREGERERVCVFVKLRYFFLPKNGMKIKHNDLLAGSN